MNEGGEELTACVRGLPKKLKIGAYDWSVLLMEGTEGDLCGLADFSVLQLRLWPENLTSPSHVVGIALHECLHVIFENQHLGEAKGSKDDREEAAILGFERGLVSLFRDNPRFLTWMKKWLK